MLLLQFEAWLQAQVQNGRFMLVVTNTRLYYIPLCYIPIKAGDEI
jgi:hypothetical protein